MLSMRLSSGSSSGEGIEPETFFDSPEAMQRRSRARRPRRRLAIAVVATVVIAVIVVATVYEVALQPPNTAVPTGTFHIQFSCNHSVVTAKASVPCSESNSTSVTLNSTGFDSCTASSCSLVTEAATFSPYIFASWTAGGNAFFGTSGSACSSSQSTSSNPVTLCMTASGSATQYNGSVTVNSV